jgi:HD-like signal output (HDOD) protein
MLCQCPPSPSEGFRIFPSIRADKPYVSTLTLPQPDLRERALRSVNQLPPFSPTLSKLLATLAKEDVFYGELSAIIEKDTVLAGHVLKLVNSALYARSGTVNSVRHAVSILGLNKLRNVALSLSVSRMWNSVKTPKSWSQAAFNVHSVATAVMADLLAQRITVRYPEGAFTAGLLHAVGKLMIAIALPEHYEKILSDYQNSSDLTMEDAELQHIGCCHSELGAAALAQWKLPAEIEDAVGHQHRPKPDIGAVKDLSRLLHEAHYIVNHLDVMIPACACQVGTNIHEAFRQLGLESQADAIIEEYKAEFGSMKSFF